MRSLFVGALVLAAAAAGACKRSGDPIGAEPITEPWTDSFDRVALGDEWHPTAGSYHIRDGALSAKGAYNHPLWLRRALPADVVIELDTWSNSPDGDIKVELFGDGRSHARNKGQYTSTGYVAVMGGWGNTLSILARGNEHGEALAKRKLPRVELGVKLHWTIVRSGQTVDWYVRPAGAPSADAPAEPFLTLTDAAPLAGDEHRFFAINNWESDSWFDNLSIRPKPE